MNGKTIVMTLAALSLATAAEAQYWDAPSFFPPRPGEDIGAYVIFPDGADFGVKGIWRQGGNLNLGVHFGWVDLDFDDNFIAGAETWGSLMSAGAEFPVDVSWTLGAGATFGNGTLVSIPVGLSIGRLLALTPMTFQVYGHPRLAVVVASAANNTDADLEGLFDLGADLHLGTDWKIRLGITLGGTDSFGVGAAYRFGRGVAVR